jgi:Co/Zn/Cd efflux system component
MLGNSRQIKEHMNIVIAIAAVLVSAFNARGFYKAGSFKSKANKEALLGAGMGWIEKTPMGVVRLIAWLEILGAIGSVVAPIGAYLTGFTWSQWVGVAAAAGLALTMLVAFIMHLVRGEAKYTWKANLSMFAFSVIAAVLQSLVVLPLI